MGGRFVLAAILPPLFAPPKNLALGVLKFRCSFGPWKLKLVGLPVARLSGRHCAIEALPVLISFGAV